MCSERQILLEDLKAKLGFINNKRSLEMQSSSRPSIDQFFFRRKKKTIDNMMWTFNLMIVTVSTFQLCYKLIHIHHLDGNYHLQLSFFKKFWKYLKKEELESFLLIESLLVFWVWSNHIC